MKVKLVDGVWVTSNSFDGSGVITKLTDFYLWNIESEWAFRQDKHLMCMCLGFCLNDIKVALELFRLNSEN